MGAPSFAAGETLAASQLKLQTVHICTSSTRPGSPFEGLTIYETDTDKIYTYNGSVWVLICDTGAWDSYTPVLTAASSNPTLGSGSSQVGAYTRSGRTIWFRATVQFGTSGTAAGSGEYRVSLPVAANSALLGIPIGFARHLDTATNYGRQVWVSAADASKAIFISEAGAATTHAVPFAWGASDAIYMTGTYEAAASS